LHASADATSQLFIAAIFAGLLRHYVRGVPVWPVRVGLPDALLVLAVGGLGAAKRGRQIVRRSELRLGEVDAPRQPGRHLLQQPPVAVRVAERGEGAVGGVVGRRPANPAARAVGQELRARRAGVEYLADRDPAGESRW
jgi:hypothetical protein